MVLWNLSPYENLDASSWNFCYVCHFIHNHSFSIYFFYEIFSSVLEYILLYRSSIQMTSCLSCFEDLWKILENTSCKSPHQNIHDDFIYLSRIIQFQCHFLKDCQFGIKVCISCFIQSVVQSYQKIPSWLLCPVLMN